MNGNTSSFTSLQQQQQAMEPLRSYLPTQQQGFMGAKGIISPRIVAQALAEAPENESPTLTLAKLRLRDQQGEITQA